MDAAQEAGAPEAILLPVVSGVESKGKNFVPPDDLAALSKPFHRLVDAITDCMTAEMEGVKKRYLTAVEIYEERVKAWATEKKALLDEKEELNTQLLQARTTADDLTATIKEKDDELHRYQSYVAVLQDVDNDDL